MNVILKVRSGECHPDLFTFLFLNRANPGRIGIPRVSYLWFRDFLKTFADFQWFIDTLLLCSKMSNRQQNKNKSGSASRSQPVRQKIEKTEMPSSSKKSGPTKKSEASPQKDDVSDDGKEVEDGPTANSESELGASASGGDAEQPNALTDSANVITQKFEELFEKHVQKQYTPANRHEADAQRSVNENIKAPIPLMGEFFCGVITKAINDSVKMVADVRTEISDLKVEVNKAAAQADQAENTAWSAMLKTDRFDQRDRSNNIRIIGLAEKPGEDTCKEVIDFASTLSVTITAGDVEDVYRVDRKPASTQTAPNNQPPKPRPIFVRFKTPDVRKKLFDAKKLIPVKHPNSKIFLCDDLTPARAKMLEKARSVPGKNAFSNGKDGSILVYPKKVQGAASNVRVKPITIREPIDLMQLPNMSASDVEGIYEIMEKT